MRVYFTEDDGAGTGVSQGISAAMQEAAERCSVLEGLDASRCAVSVSIVSPEEIRELNRDYRGIDRVTDVLSFPQYESPGAILDAQRRTGDEPVALGDVVICRERAEEQAEEFGHPVEREFLYLFVHSVLHLLGYDHMEPEEKSVMRVREEEIMKYLGVER